MTPIELYRFQMGSQVWTFTSAETGVSYGGEWYGPVSIGRGGFESKNELSKSNLEIRLDILNPLSRLLMKSFTEQVMSLSLYNQSDLGTNVVWKGRLASFKPTSTHLAMSFESVFTSLRRPGLRARFQRSCRHALYGRGCKLDPESFAVPGLVTAVAGAVLTVPEAAAQPDGFYIGGMVRAPDGILSFIVGHVGSSLTLIRPSNSIQKAFDSGGYGNNYGFAYGGTNVTIYPGCDHSRATCLEKFNNLPNYGGFDWIPAKNPMGGSSIV